MPAAASTTHSRSSARREPNTATPSGPTNSNVTRHAERDPVERLVERVVHPGQADAERTDQRPLPARAPAHRRPPERREHDRREQGPQQHGAAGADVVEQRLGQRAPELHRRRRPENERDGRDAVGHWRQAIRAMDDTRRLERIFEGHDAPFALVDLDAMWSNAAEMLARSAGKPIRVASKSVRCRAGARAHPRPRRALPRAHDVHAAPRRCGCTATASATCCWPTPPPTARRWPSWARLEGDGRPIVMVDSAEQLDLIARRGGGAGRADPPLHRVRHRLPHGGRAGEDRPQALAHPHARAGGGAGRARSRRATGSSWPG